MIEKAWLHMLYECEIRNIDLPLDFVAHRLYPGATGEALIQRTDRLRKELIAEGHLVPPKAGKKGTNLDAKIRGHVRKYPGDADKLLQTRDVLFTEPMEDAQHADPTGFMLVHNRAARNKAANVIGKNNKGNAGNEHENLDSESTDEAAKSDDGGFDKDKAATPNDNKDKVKRFAKSLENPRTSARLRTAPKKSYKEVANLDSDYVVDADDEAVVNHKGGRSLNATHGYDHDDEEEEYGEDGDDLPTTESEGNHTNTTKRVTSQYQLPHDIAPFGAFDLTPGSFADEEDNIFVSLLTPYLGNGELTL